MLGAFLLLNISGAILFSKVLTMVPFSLLLGVFLVQFIMGFIVGVFLIYITKRRQIT